jgi:uncharacterized heparinase superfamily protein
VDAPRLPSPSSAALAVQAAGEGARRFLEREWFGTPFHTMTIAGPRPDGLAANPRDLRPVELDRGRKILGGVFDLAAVQKANAALVATIEDSLRIADEARGQRARAAEELQKLEGDIRRALTQAKAGPTAPRPL